MPGQATPLTAPSPHPSAVELPGDRSRERLQASTTAAVLSLAAIGLILLLRFAGAPLMLIAVPAAVGGAVFCLAKPAAGVTFVVFLTGFIGTVIAHAGIPAESLAQSILVCLWIAVLVLYATGRARGRLWFWPGLALPALYILVTLVGILVADDPGAAFAGFKLAGWYMSAFLLLAVAPWGPGTVQRIAKGVAVVALMVGAYALFRKLAGSSGEELALARQSTGVRSGEEIRFFGSFLGPQQLSAWGAAAIPFLLALALAWKGRWRAVALVAAALCTFAVIASDIRTGMVGAAAGVGFVLLLYQVSQAFRGPRLAVGVAALLAIAGVATAGYFATISDSDSSSDRFENILNPGNDYAYLQREARWEDAVEAINRRPLGHGLGTVGTAAVFENPENIAGPINLDSSYLKVGLEQGYPILALFVVSLLALLGGLARRAAGTLDPWRAALGLGACGTLVAQINLYYGSTYVEGIPALFAWCLIGLGAAPFTWVQAEEESSEEPGRSDPAGITP